MFLRDVYKGSLELPRGVVTSSKAEPEPEKKLEHQPRSHRDVGAQKEPVVPGIVDFELVQEELKISKPQTPRVYRFGRLSHHSFFSRHHPQPQLVTHIPGREQLDLSLPLTTSFQLLKLLGSTLVPQPTDLTFSADVTGKRVCVIRDEFSLATLPQSTYCLMGIPTISTPIGDPKSNRNPQLSSSDTWKKKLRDLAARVAIFTNENEVKTNEVGTDQRNESGKK
uniref:Thymus, brain and testes associated n=1 Tax=Nannospalax galili TaxID=1026970 RepID=A0A8C6W2Z9_NANGA